MQTLFPFSLTPLTDFLGLLSGLRKRALLMIVFILGFHAVGFAQETQQFNGIVLGDSTVAKDVSVLNLRTRRGTITNLSGQFKIPVKIGDTLLFTSLSYQTKRIPINQKVLNSQPIVVHLKGKVFSLKEITITNTQLTGFLAIDADYIESETPASILSKKDLPFSFREPMTAEERRLYTATTSSSGIPLAPMLNKLSGRMAMLKRQKRYAETERMVGKGMQLMPRNFFTEKLGISPLLVENFVHFCLRFDAFKKLIHQYDQIGLTEFYKSKVDDYRAHRKGKSVD